MVKLVTHLADHATMTTQFFAVEGASRGVSSLTLLAVAFAVFAAAVAWRGSRIWKMRSRVRAAMRSNDASVRVQGAEQAGEIGLATNAADLLRLVRRESDQTVLAAVVRIVAGRQWEPASNAALVELRLWARAYVDQHPELRRAHVSDAPLLPGVAGAAIVPSLDPQRAVRFQRKTDTAHAADAHDAAANPKAPLVVDDPDRLGTTRVLVTGAGGPAGVAVILALRQRGHYVIAADCDPLAVGLRLASEHVVIPRFTDPLYVAAIVRAATVTNAQALICTVAEEYPALISGTDYLTEAGVRTLLPSAKSAATCTDKWAFATAMREAGVPAPTTGLGTADGVPGPWVVKPRHGRGSRDVVLCDTLDSVRDALHIVPEPIVQTRLTGTEFTCDVLIDPTGQVAGAVPRWRLETKAGISVKGQTFDSDDVLHVVSQVIKAVGLIGPVNVQGFVTDDGVVNVHEVNPRFSGALPLSLAAGADLVEEYLRAVLGLPIRPERLKARPDVMMFRYFSEVFEG